MKQYYIIINDKTAGPFSIKEVEALYNSGTIEGTFLYSTTESKDWMPVSILVPTFLVKENDADIIPLPTNNPSIVINNSNINNPYPYNTYIPNTPFKSRVTYQLLALFFGFLGMHNFYIGRDGIGVIQIAFSLLSFGFLVPLIWIWAIIEIFAVKFDGHNRPLS